MWNNFETGFLKETARKVAEQAFQKAYDNAMNNISNAPMDQHRIKQAEEAEFEIIEEND